MKIYLGGHNSSTPLHNASAPAVAGTETSLANALLAVGIEICDRLDDADALVLIDMDINLLKNAHKTAEAKLPVVFVCENTLKLAVKNKLKVSRKRIIIFFNFNF